MANSLHGGHGQERSLQAIQVAAISGFVEHNLRLQESCLALCNSCREYVPLQFVTICLDGPSTLLAVFRPDLLCLEVDGNSRVILPKKVLKVDWAFNDHGGRHFVERRFSRFRTEDEIAKHCGVTAWNFDMSKVRWPTGVREVYLSTFNRLVDEVVWPGSLKRLAFCWPGHDDKFSRCDVLDNFNQSLNGVTFPAGLREIYLGPEFDRRIESVAWPEGLELLSMPGFNYPIRDVQWPPRLKTLSFLLSSETKHRQSPKGWARAWNPCAPNVGFNEHLDSFLPMSLETLWLSDNFDQSLRGVTWPGGLALLGLGTRMSAESLDGIEWPLSLRKLVLTDFFEDVYDPHPGCEVVTIRLDHGDWIPLD